MKRLFIGLAAFLVIVVVGIVTVAMLIPKDTYKTRIETAAADALGRDVALNGDVGLGFFPRISASIEDVTVANPEGFSDEYMVQAGALRASVKWMPLFTGRVEVQEIAFVDADVRLERREDGVANWEFPASEDATEETGPDAPETTQVNAGVDRARLVNASLSYKDSQAGQAFAVSDFNMEASLQSLDAPLSARGEGFFQEEAFAFTLDLTSPQDILDGNQASIDMSLEMDLANLTYDGTATLSDAASVDGAFAFSAPNLSALAAYADVDAASLPVRLEPLGGLSTNGRVSGPVDALTLDFEKLDVSGDDIQLGYTGSAKLTETPSLDGAAKVSLQNMEQLITALGVELPERAALRNAKLDLTTRVSGPSDAISASGIDLSLDGPLIKASYAGDLSLAGDGSLNGTLGASSADLRGLLAAAAIEMEPGDTLQSFDISGTASGSFVRTSIDDLNLKVDDITGSGNLMLRTDTTRPVISGSLATGPLDLNPFMGEAPDDQPEGWSKAPLALESLNTVDADIVLTSPAITADKITVRDADLRVQLVNGVLAANINQFNLFGGAWQGNIGVNASGATPTLAVTMTGENILMQDIMETFVGTDRLTGGGQFRLEVVGQGQSLYDIMNSLDGALSTDLADGAIRGMNIGQLVRSATDLRSSLASGSFDLGLSPSESSDFTKFSSVLQINDGVAQIELMEIFSSTFGANGLGSINLGSQSLDMSLKIAADTGARGELQDIQLNNIGIPLRITGSWTSPRIVPDTTALTSALAGNALDRVLGTGTSGEGVEGIFGNAARDALSGVIGRRPAEPAAPTDDSDPEPPADDGTTPEDAEDEEEEPETVEEVVEDAAREALGNLFGRRKRD